MNRKTVINILYINPTILIIALNLNGLIHQIKIEITCV